MKDKIKLIDEVELVNIDELIKYQNNPKVHPEEQIDTIATSISETGFDQPIVIDKDNVIIKGHARLEACKKLGLDKAPVIKRKDLDKAKAKISRIMDNKSAESEWDTEKLGLELEELDEQDYNLELTGFDEEEIDGFLKEDKIKEPKPEGLPNDLEDWNILNLYAGIGGNRKFWKGNITAVEYNEEIAKAYQDFFPEDEVIIADAHDYLEEHFEEYDFIWSSPPCPTHSRLRNPNLENVDPVYPDMRLYEEIILLDNFFDGKYCVENVISYYEPLIKPQKIQRHYFWSNFDISDIEIKTDNIKNGNIKEFQKRFDFDLSDYSFSSDYPKDKILKNCIHPELGEHILKAAFEE